MPLSKNQFIRLWLFSALAVTILRLLHGPDFGYDLTIQLQAAQNLAGGHGLSVYSILGEEDLAVPNRLILLTYFPAGYSILAALLMLLGIGAPIATQILAATGTLLGWWGWGRLAYAFMKPGLDRSPRWRWIAIVSALVTPLFFTPPWSGTDIFLWAAVPWVVQWLGCGADPLIPNRTRFDVFAGALCGLTVLLRYQGLVMLGYAALLIVFQSAFEPKMLVRRAAMFAVAAFPFLALQACLNYVLSAPSTVAPGGLVFDGQLGAHGHAIWISLLYITTVNSCLVWWAPRKILQFFTQSGDHAPWLLALTLAGIFVAPFFFAAKLGVRHVVAASRDVRTAAAGLFLLFPLFLFGCAFGGAVYSGIARYYSPLLPLALLVAYAWAVPEDKPQGYLQTGLRLLNCGYLAFYISMAVFGLAVLFLPGKRGSTRRAWVLGTSHFGHWFSSTPKKEISVARDYVLALWREEPNTILVTNEPHWFYADPTVDRSRLHRIQGMQAKYVTGPVRIVIAAADPFPVPDTALYWYGTFGNAYQVHYFESVPDLHLVRRFPDENIKILESRIPAGTRIDLKR